MVKTGVKANHIGPLFDSISLCFSKGLGTPVGSVLIGSKDFIQKVWGPYLDIKEYYMQDTKTKLLITSG